MRRKMYQVVGHDAYTGENHYVPISDLNTFLTELRNSEGTWKLLLMWRLIGLYP